LILIYYILKGINFGDNDTHTSILYKKIYNLREREIGREEREVLDKMGYVMKRDRKKK